MVGLPLTFRKGHKRLFPILLLSKVSDAGTCKETEMARRCDLCGKGPLYGHNISHAHNLTKRRWNPNLQRVRIQTQAGGAKRMRLCTRCIR